MLGEWDGLFEVLLLYGLDSQDFGQVFVEHYFELNMELCLMNKVN